MKICPHCETRFSGSGWECPSCHSVPDTMQGVLSFAPQFAADEGFNPEYFKELSELEERNFWFRARNKLICWGLRRYFQGCGNFLEIGCGTGFVLTGIRKEFPGVILSGSEIFHRGLSFARERAPDACFFQMDARAIPFEDEFDVVGAFDVLEHILDDMLVLKQMFQAVRPGGGIILTVPQHPLLWSQADQQACHVRRYRMCELESKVLRAGFHVLRRTSFVSLLLPFMMTVRLGKCALQEEYDVMDELRVSEPLNGLLGNVLALEQGLIHVGVDFPFGGSSLLIARKG